MKSYYVKYIWQRNTRYAGGSSRSKHGTYPSSLQSFVAIMGGMAAWKFLGLAAMLVTSSALKLSWQKQYEENLLRYISFLSACWEAATDSLCQDLLSDLSASRFFYFTLEVVLQPSGRLLLLLRAFYLESGFNFIITWIISYHRPIASFTLWSFIDVYFLFPCMAVTCAQKCLDSSSISCSWGKISLMF